MNRHCLSCVFEPDWVYNRGKCRLALFRHGDKKSVLLIRYFDPDEVITAEGNRVVDCTGWEEKQENYEVSIVICNMAELPDVKLIHKLEKENDESLEPLGYVRVGTSYFPNKTVINYQKKQKKE